MFRHNFSNEDVRTLTVVCGGMAFLVALAVWIAPSNNSVSDNFSIVDVAQEQSLAASGIPDSLNDPLPPVDSGVLAESGGGGGTCEPEPPFVITGNATNITYTSAQVSASGGSGCLAYSGPTRIWFRYGITGCTTRAPASGYAAGGTTVLTGLSPNTTYYYCASGQNAAGMANGAQRSFKTPALSPVVVTGPETVVTPTSATLTGTVDPNGVLTSYLYRYSKTPGTCATFGSVTPLTSAGNAQTPTNRPHLVTGLTSNTTYYYCIAAINSLGAKVYGAVGILRTATAAALPTLSISANGQLGTITVDKDTDVTIRATFAAAAGDALKATAINGPAPYTYAGAKAASFDWVSAPNVDSVPPRSVVTYTFRPTQTGNYTFIPSVLTNVYPGPWYDAGKFVTVHVVCEGACACPANTSSINGVCVPNSCPAGTHVVGSQCVPNASGGPGGPGDQCLNMPGNQSVVPANCKLQIIPSGTECVPINGNYQVVGTKCVLKGVIHSFTANPMRLRAGESTTLTWEVSGMTSCGITASNKTLPVVPQSNSSGKDGTHSVADSVPQITNYRLTCTDGVDIITSEKTVTVVPAYEEI